MKADLGPEPTVSVRSEPVMGPGERAAFVTLTIIVVLASGSFGVYWLAVVRDGVASVAFTVSTLIGAFLWASWFGRWLLLWKMRRPIPMPAAQSLRVAVVTTYVPEAEPIGMLEQSVRAMVAMDYPHDTWVLDEGGTDEMAALCQRLGARYFSRKDRPEYSAATGRFARGTKFGNYNAWLAEAGADYDVLASFDPDHIPEQSFLRRVLGFFAEPKVAYVQAPQVYYNQRASLVAAGAAEETYAYYSTHHMASYGMGHTILVGSHGTQRIAALQEVGGFAAHDADDLLITMRYSAAGWHGVFMPEILALGLTPAGWSGYLRQQVRWTRSVVDLKLKQLPKLTRRLTLLEWLLAFFHGVFYLRSLTVPVLYGVIAALVLTGARPAFASAPALAAAGALGLALGAIGRFRTRFFFDPERESDFPWRSLLLQLVKWPFQAGAVWAAFRGKTVPYEITSKIGPGGRRSVILWPHWIVGAAMALILPAGLLIHGAVAPMLAALAATVVAFSIVVCLTEWFPEALPWEPDLYRRRRAELAPVLGPMRWPAVERRRFPRGAMAGPL